VGAVFQSRCGVAIGIHTIAMNGGAITPDDGADLCFAHTRLLGGSQQIATEYGRFSRRGQ